MATTTQVNAFIKQLSALAIAEAKKRTKWVLPSICIAQAALETGWGTSSLMNKANAYFGIKATTAWVNAGGKVYDSKTSECYDGKTYVNIVAAFRAYDSVADSVKDYYDLITSSSRYAAAVCNKDAESTITAIKNGGYATAPDYITKVMRIVTQYKLTQYDEEIINPKTSTTTVKTVGFLDTATLKDGKLKVTGWAWKGAGSQKVTIKVFNGTTVKKTVTSTANVSRADVMKTMGYNTDKVGYSQTIDVSSYASGSYTIKVFLGTTQLTNEKTVKVENTPVIKAGQKITLKKAKGYSTATATTVATTKSGTFYLWDDQVIRDRIRITNSSANVGKNGQVTCWIDVTSINS